MSFRSTCRAKRWAAFAVCGWTSLCVPQAALGQQILIDRGVRAAGLWCFPLSSDTLRYVYLPAHSRLAEDDQGRPQFSFVRYVVNQPATAGEGVAGATISSAGGGGILHFLVLYETPPEAVAAAERALQEILNSDAVTLRGPVIFSGGRYALISSILSPTGTTERNVLATGSAPVLEGNRIALSFELSPERASLLMESFKMATPDVSLAFDMQFSGLTEAYEAELLIDWAEVRKSVGFQAGGSLYFVGADVELALDSMRRDNAIQLRSSGSDESMEALLTTVYNKLLELLFRPVEPEELPEDSRGNLFDALASIADVGLGSRRLTGFGFHAGYQFKEMRSEGTSILNFNHRSSVERHGLITFNIGDFYTRFGADTTYFKVVNLGDPVYDQRNVHVGLDGALLPEFDRYINSVTVTLRKIHGDNSTTLREVVIGRNTPEEEIPRLRMVYGWSHDSDRLEWLAYEYRTKWSFEGGGSYETDWIRSDGSQINLYAPYQRRTIQLVGDAVDLERRGVRAVIVYVEYPFFGESRRHQLVVRPGDVVEDKTVEITLPRDEFAYNYRIRWLLEGGQIEASGSDDTGLIFIDEIPG